MKHSKIDDVLDSYFNSPIFWDCVVIAVVILANTYAPFIPFKTLDKGQQMNLLSNLISTTVSLAGFILAALTIIVTFKSSLKAKGFEDSGNALEYFFSTSHYRSIVEVFRKAITELVIIFVVLYFVWLSSENIRVGILWNFLLGSMIATVTSILRSLYILFNILGLQFLEKK